MLFKNTTLLLLVAGFITSTLAQTWTSCNPLNRTDCPLDTALGRSNYSIDFRTETMSDRVWNATAGSVTYGDDGAQFTINQKGDSPTVQTNFYYFFGQCEVIMRAATGQGIISSIVLESDDLDEVDWEFMGGNNSFVETNYFGKGNTTAYNRAIYYPVSDPENTFHNYTTQWTAEKLEWFIDGELVRTLYYADANGGYNYPQTPMNVRLGIWAGGDPSEPKGVIEWAGGVTNYDDAPFTMTVQSVRVSDFSGGTQYKYGNESGSWQSIQILDTAPALKLDGNNNPTISQSVEQKWHGLSKTTKIIIAASALGALLLCVAVFAFYCVKQRRAGHREKLLDDDAYEKQRAEALAYRSQMAGMGSQTQPLYYTEPQTPQPASTNYAQDAGSWGARSQASLGSNAGYAQSVYSFTAPGKPATFYGNTPYGAGGRGGYARY